MQIASRPALRAVLIAGVLHGLAGCATRSADVPPLPTDPAAYQGWTCERLFDELDTVQQRAADVAYAVDARAGNNMIALGLGVTVFWPALLAMRPDGPDAAQLAELKGRFEALQQQASAQQCGPPPATMAPQRAASLPVAVGDRLVYDDRQGHGGVAGQRELGLRVTLLRRDGLDFAVDIDGQTVSRAWHQDLAGNVMPDSPASMLRWQRLLRPDLVLGQVLAGELTVSDDLMRRARVRGQVVATGPQQLAGRSFDVAVIELFGDAPPATVGSDGSTRLDGVMAVDRRSGVLLRLELRCANPDFAVRRRLVRVESGAR
ncbi:MAG: hypothetical protein CFE45_17205 [Burkholderiales bacterium PBB5]|nr:MAG: hypothetical protein CFE45_17205 [Burkholderiales bacterium PBB5]